MVKRSITVSIETDLIKRMDEIVSDDSSPFYRSRSHLVEYYIRKCMPKKDVSTVALEIKEKLDDDA